MTADMSIVVRRIRTTNLEVVNMTIEVSSGAFGGAFEIWCPIENVGAVGRALGAFPSKVPDRYEFYFEGETQNLSFAVKTVDSVGHSALEIELTTTSATCRLLASAEPASINRLGGLFNALVERPTGAFRWTPLDAQILPLETELI